MEETEGKIHGGEDVNMVYVSARNNDNTEPILNLLSVKLTHLDN